MMDWRANAAVGLKLALRERRATARMALGGNMVVWSEV